MWNIIKKNVHHKYEITYIYITEVITLEITDIRIRQMTHDDKMKAVVSVTFDNAFVVHDIKVIEGQEKLFTAMPSRRTPDPALGSG